MKCIKETCSGQLRNCSPINRTKFRYNHKLVDVPKNGSVRTRKCTKCALVVKTIEIPLNRYFADIEFMNSVKQAIHTYVDSSKQE